MKPPVIDTSYGPTTESRRKQAAIYMKADPERRARVEQMLMEKLGNVPGLAECQRRFPEAYDQSFTGWLRLRLHVSQKSWWRMRVLYRPFLRT
jgi:SH3-like domain-containing protein